MKSILITGASSGFGMNTALALAKAGWRVFATSRDPAKGGLKEAAIAEGVQNNIELLALDVTNNESVEQTVTTVLRKTGGTLDALLNNAGYSAMGAFEDWSDEECRRQMDTNFFGTLAVTRAVLPIMRKAQQGRIIVVSSNSVNAPHPMLAMYAASKWALEGWAEAMAMELAPFGVEIVLVQPGAHRTPFAQHVKPIFPEGSAYKQWMEVAMPGIGNLDAWGRDPQKAMAQIVAAITEPNPPFRRAIGEDTIAFSTLKGLFPYEVRAWAVRAIVGVPLAGQFVDAQQRETSESPVLEQVLNRVVNAATQSPDRQTSGSVTLLASALASLRQ